MDSFMFSLNATMPVFLVMVCGYVFRQMNLINDNFAEVADKLVFNVALPVYVFQDIAGCDLKADLSPKFALFCAGATCAFFFGTWILSEVFIKDKNEIGSFVQGAYRGSAAVLGIAFAENIYGDAGMVPAMIVASIPLFNIFAVIILSRSDKNNASLKPGRLLINILKNPILVGIFAGIPFAILQVDFPPIVDKTLGSIGALSTPLALISIGASFMGSEAISKIKLTVVASVVKLVVIPAIFLPIAVWMGFRDAHLLAITILLGAPSTVSGYIMAKNMNNDYVLSSNIVVATTLFSSVSITAIIYILRALALI